MFFKHEHGATFPVSLHQQQSDGLSHLGNILDTITLMKSVISNSEITLLYFPINIRLHAYSLPADWKYDGVGGVGLGPLEFVVELDTDA